MASPSTQPAQEASAAPPATTPTTPTGIHVTSIPDVCMKFPSGDKIFANVAVLRNASPVFRAMLGPDFQEGHSIMNNPGHMQEIEFPEDNRLAMLTLARLLHHHYHDIEADGKLTAESIYDLAIVADKYDACHVVKLPFAAIVNVDETDSWKLWYMLSAAHIVGHRDVFKKLSIQLLLYHTGPYISLYKTSKALDEPNLWIAALLESRRADLRSSISSHILKHLAEIKSGSFIVTNDKAIGNSVHVSYDDPIHKTLKCLTLVMGAKRPEDAPTHLEVAVKELEKNLSEGICFDCVGTTEMHSEHSGKKKKTT